MLQDRPAFAEGAAFAEGPADNGMAVAAPAVVLGDVAGEESTTMDIDSQAPPITTTNK